MVCYVGSCGSRINVCEKLTGVPPPRQKTAKHSPHTFPYMWKQSTENHKHTNVTERCLLIIWTTHRAAQRGNGSDTPRWNHHIEFLIITQDEGRRKGVGWRELFYPRWSNVETEHMHVSWEHTCVYISLIHHGSHPWRHLFLDARFPFLIIIQISLLDFLIFSPSSLPCIIY